MADDLLAKKIAAQTRLMKTHAMDRGSGGRIPGKEREEIAFRSTGLEVLDREVLGIGGVPKGKIIEVYGKESSGKTALSLYIAGKVQQEDPTATVKIYDAERAWTDTWGESMGIDLNRTFIPEFRGADAMGTQIQADIADEFPPDIIIIDSLAVIQPQQVLGKTVDNLNMNDNMARATFYTNFFNKIVDGYYWPALSKGESPSSKHKFCDLKKSGTTLICINHAKQKTVGSGPMTRVEWYTVGGVSLDFHASIRLGVKRGKIDLKEKLSYQTVHVKADKNKVAPPLRECDIRLSYKGGMEQIGSIDYLEKAEKMGVVEIRGGWIYADFLEGGKIQGKTKFNEFISSNDMLKKRFEVAI